MKKKSKKGIDIEVTAINLFLCLLLVSLVIINFKTTAYGYFSWIIMLALIGILIAVLVSGKMVNQAKSWIDILSVQLFFVPLQKISKYGTLQRTIRASYV